MVDIPDPLKTHLKKIEPKPMAFTNEMILRLECVKQAVTYFEGVDATSTDVINTAKTMYSYVEKGE
jgi:hypothetical protein